VSYNKMIRPWNKLAVGLQWLTTQRGFAASNIWEAGGLIKGNETMEYPNLQYHFAPIAAEFEGSSLRMTQGFTIQIDQLRPFSKGYVTLNSADPADKPATHYNYLADPRDLQELIDARHRITDLIAQSAFDPYRGKPTDPSGALETESEVAQWIRKCAGTDFHPSCSCRMGVDDDAVVDGELKVHGIEGLRVVDASVMPDIVSGNLNAPTQMIAARAADFILGKPALTPEHASFHFE
ncbi:MAG: choline dehydrogenase, partial [Gammaproteobacteria bacterium]